MTWACFARFAGALLWVVALPALADAGAFQFVSGDVRIIRPDGREIAAAKGAKVLEGDAIVTGANGHAQLLMADQALISLRPDSNLRFDTYRYAGKEDGSEKGVLGLIKGGFRTLTGLIGRANKNNYLVRTPTATIGIRGTDHEPYYIPPEGWPAAPEADPGTYSRVNAGSTFLQTEGGRLELEANQVGFVPPNPQAQPLRLDQMPAFMRPPASQGERRGPGDGSGRRGAPQGGRLPPQQPPAGGLLPRSGDSPLFFEPQAVGGSFGFSQAVADLSAAPYGTAGVGGDRSQDSRGIFFGSGAGIASPNDLEILLDSSGHLALVADQDGFRYARSGAPLVHSGGAMFMDGSTPVAVKWGIYGGGAIVDAMGPRAVDYFHFMSAQGTPVAIAATLSGTYNMMVGTPPVITELGVGAPTGLTASIVLAGGGVTSYSVSMMDDGFGRAWSASCPSCTAGIPLLQFVQNGVPLSGSGPGGAAIGNGHGAPVGPTGQGIVSSFDLRTATAGVTGSFAVKK